MKILIFTEGTILMPASGKNVSREERVRQVVNNNPSVDNFASYTPVGNAAEKINKWKEQGAEICYMTSRNTPQEISDIQNVLTSNNFPYGKLFYRRDSQEYIDVLKGIMPDVLVEDDCESIGGAKEMTSTYMDENLRRKIKVIVVKEFGGINHLPDIVQNL